MPTRSDRAGRHAASAHSIRSYSYKGPRNSSRATIAVSGDVVVVNFASAENPISQSGTWINGGNSSFPNSNWNDVRLVARAGGGANILAATAFVSSNGSDDYNDSIAHYSGAINPNQYAEATVFLASNYKANCVANGSTHEAELLLRFSITTGNPGSATGYEILWDSPGNLVPVRWNGSRGNYTPMDINGAGPNGDGVNCITSGSTNAQTKLVDGAILRAEISGDIITTKINTGTGFVTQWTADISLLAGTKYTSGKPGVGFFPRNDGTADLVSKGWSSFRAGNL